MIIIPLYGRSVRWLQRSYSSRCGARKPLLNRLLPLIEAFFVLHGVEEPSTESSVARVVREHVFAEHQEQSAAERSRFGQFCKKHRRPLNALLKQTPGLLTKSFAPLLQLMPSCLDFDNKRAYFRSEGRMIGVWHSVSLDSLDSLLEGVVFLGSIKGLKRRQGTVEVRS